eukprot:GHVN01004337.1.p1 GENE.GHVN01004337.1~~GHVN01004337.1.p1  ORF type:complete len:493 (+),score=25.46 GHVN01004337.1:62-1540(+)
MNRRFRIICFFGTSLLISALSTLLARKAGYFTEYNSPIELEPHRKRNLSYHKALKQVADPDGVVLLSLIDTGFLPMAINFYLTCIAAHSITNYLFLATDQAVCDLIPNINCKFYRSDVDSLTPSVWASPAFRRKMNIRTDMILEALELGYKVLHSDVDIYCSRHPITHINCRIGECDMAALPDHKTYNAGFIYINPTEASKQVYNLMQEMAIKSEDDDQCQLNKAIKQSVSSLKAEKLSATKFQCGKRYYQGDLYPYQGGRPKHRYFARDLQSNPCPECVVIHNNWIVSMAAKVYRFKELHQWFYDGVQQYYTSLDRKYIVYDNPVVDANAAPQLEALKSAMAIGQILNRTVILPRFHCPSRDCPLSCLVKISSFDKQFGEGYRESSFLSHPLVPKQIVESEAGPYLVLTNFVKHHLTDSMDLTQENSKTYTRGFTEEEVILNFKDIKHRVIRFVALYEAFSGFINEAHQTSFEESFRKATHFSAKWLRAEM